MAKNMIISAFVGKKRVKCAGANYSIQNLTYTYIYGNFARILQKIFVSARDSYILFPFLPLPHQPIVKFNIPLI
jgi:hypothetical protein